MKDSDRYKQPIETSSARSCLGLVFQQLKGEQKLLRSAIAIRSSRNIMVSKDPFLQMTVILGAIV
jgi:hypothetical protein